jgi:uncharacterized protein YjiS (DUF1127 family)
MTMRAPELPVTPTAFETGSAGLLRRLTRALANRRQLGRLRRLSDRGLADIGLMRLDLDFVGRAPLGVDPTLRLASVARERAVKS